MLEKAVDYSHSLLKSTVSPGDTVIDATVGKGNDTILLASLVGKSGRVIGFDVQEKAIRLTREKCLLTGLSDQVTLHHIGHEKADEFVPANTELGGIIYNLGYLPGSDKSITTLLESTLASIQKLLPLLRVGSLMILVVYSGHPEGETEKNGVLHFVKNLDQNEFSVLQYGFINQQNNPPFVLAIEKRKNASSS
ncbi:class I SAM-dependent methyltransferase [Jeotgalibaca sp. A127]|uniref:class I SAM-dependent methyltransferase n=1 Tax=Jeotgalibaca sp. A127 TaxID=3457324 RepID=UPI003FD50874